MSKRNLMISIVFIAAITAGITAYYSYRPNAVRVDKIRQWIQNPS